MRISTVQKAIGAVSLAAVATGLVACSSTHRDAPEPKGDNILNGANTQVVQMPDGFRNFAFTCYGTDGVFVTSRSTNGDTSLPSSIFVVPGDEHCK